MKHFLSLMFFAFMPLIFSLGCTTTKTPVRSLAQSGSGQLSSAQIAKSFYSDSADHKRLIPGRLVVDSRHVTNPKTELMGERISTQFPGFFYRGLDLKNGVADLRNILVNGLQINKTSFNKIFLAEAPGTALDYMDTGASKAIKAVFVIYRGNREYVLQKNLGPGKSYYTSATSIPAGEIAKIYILNKNGDPVFPFFEYTPVELAEIVGLL